MTFSNFSLIGAGFCAVMAAAISFPIANACSLVFPRRYLYFFSILMLVINERRLTQIHCLYRHKLPFLVTIRLVRNSRITIIYLCSPFPIAVDNVNSLKTVSKLLKKRNEIAHFLQSFTATLDYAISNLN
jgi:hypothetical protein